MQFMNVRDFEASLIPKTSVPSHKIGALMGLSRDDLKRQAKSIRQMEKRMADLLSESAASSERLGVLLSELDLRLFSQDHDWRQTFSELKSMGPECDSHRRVALAKYMQYLGSRLEALKNIYKEKKHDVAHVDGSDGPDGPDVPGVDPSLKDTGIFEITRYLSPEAERLTRLPRGEPVSVRIPGEDGLSLKLARNAFTLYAGSTYRLVDEKGASCTLAGDVNVVGRHRGNQVPVDPEFRDVSRRHVLIELLSPDTVRMTDLSSHGTFVSPDAIVG